MSASRFAGFRSLVALSSVLSGRSLLMGCGVFRPNSKVRIAPEQNPPPHFWRKTPVLVLLLTSTGCSQLDSICQSGFLGANYALLFLFIETLVAAVVVALVISAGFYTLQRQKLGKWDLRRSESAPKVSAAQLFPTTIILIPLVFAGLLFGADCSGTQKGVHILGAFLGWIVGCGIGFSIFRALTQSYKKKKSNKEKKSR